MDRTSTVTLAVRDAYSVNVQAFAKALQGAEKEAQKLSGTMQLLHKVTAGAKDFMMGFGVALPINPMMALGQATRYVIDAATESEDVFAQTVAGVKSTGGAAGYTAEQLRDMAAAFQSTTTYSDEAILSSENLLITFDKIRGPILKDATQAILDLSTRMGGDLQGAAIQVGKALQDPAQGLTALRRVGVSFNDEQIKVIKSLFDTGHEAEAQTMILKELAHEFGGSASAAANTFTGTLKQTENQINDVAEEIGAGLITQLGYLAKDFRDVKDLFATANLPAQAFRHTVDEMRDSVGAGNMSVEDYNKAVFDLAGTISYGNTQIQTAITQTYGLTDAQADALMQQNDYNAAVDAGTAFFSQGYIPATSHAAQNNTEVATSADDAADSVDSLNGQINALHDKHIVITVEQRFDQQFNGSQGVEGGVMGSPLTGNGNIKATSPTYQTHGVTPVGTNPTNNTAGKHGNQSNQNQFAAGGFAAIGTSGTVGEDGMEAMQVTPYGTKITPINDNRNQSKVTINVYTSQPPTPRSVALLRAQAGAY